MPVSHPRPSARAARLLVVVGATVALLAGCGVEAATGDAPAFEPGPPTTGPDTTEPTEPKVVTVEALEGILPKAVDVPNAYSTDTSADGDGDLTEALDAECPEAVAITDDDEDDEAKVDFVSRTDGATLGVRLDLAPPVAAEELDDLMTAIGECGEIEVDSADVFGTVTPSAERIEGRGDAGVRVVLAADFDSGGVNLVLEYSATYFVTNGVAVVVVASSGLQVLSEDPPDYKTLPIDAGAVDDLADLMTTRVEEITG